MFRFIPAVWRYKCLILLFTAAGAGDGWSAVRLIAPQSEARAIILVKAGDVAGAGPIQPTELYSSQTWQELLWTQLVLPLVVREFHLARRSDAAGERAAVESLAERLELRLDHNGDFLRVSLVGSDPERTANVLNAILESSSRPPRS
jgi:uncharacterized protein involved in exopolysaccharide biosynthesis